MVPINFHFYVLTLAKKKKKLYKKAYKSCPLLHRSVTTQLNPQLAARHSFVFWNISLFYLNYCCLVLCGLWYQHLPSNKGWGKDLGRNQGRDLEPGGISGEHPRAKPTKEMQFWYSHEPGCPCTARAVPAIPSGSRADIAGGKWHHRRQCHLLPAPHPPWRASAALPSGPGRAGWEPGAAAGQGHKILCTGTAPKCSSDFQPPNLWA